MTAPPLPHRPRLAEHVFARRHFVDGEEIVVLHDTRSGDLHRTGPRAWELLAAADGTRDFDGIILAAARRGAYRRASELRGLLEHLAARGLLADGIYHPEPTAELEPAVRDRPLDVLPSFSLTCDESGACCGNYGTILFTPLEAARARTLLPLVLGAGPDEARAFMPERGVASGGALAVTLVNNRCAYLADDGRCGLHVAGGEEAKPEACRIYPGTFVDDGDTIRVSVGVECACVLESAGTHGGAPLVPDLARTAADLGKAAKIVPLPLEIPLRQGELAPRAAFVAWSRVVAARLGSADLAVPDLLWALGREVSARGLTEQGTQEILGRWAAGVLSPPAAEEIAPWIKALGERARARVESAAAWRSERDRSRLASVWIAEATASLEDPAALSLALLAPGRFADEAFYLRAVVHGHHLVLDGPLADALCDRAVRLLVARALSPVLDRAGAPAKDRAHPLAMLEMIMRGHGLRAYVEAVAR